ncbi:monocarboxylate transporter, putative [Ixodes scapularis]|uniref:Monocarboxylate transporter, putative n=1 Tax=Ixodes scapularis TaxID=6945 RepID=B7PTJ3_IXOSC|nr:monocarboxylate transporter, putative [Ixodes scapularis]|eukprot:XP_002404476.1 monocarboxylate transporter, putative [Ixodes scapularis]
MVAVGCSCMNFFTVVMIRSAGVVYVNIVDYFGVTRQEAAWPISIVPGCANLAGPFVAVIVRKVGVRPVAIIGTFMMSLSIMLCFFAPNILYLSVFLGVFHGIGSGMTITPNAVCLNEWFDRMKVRASGIIYTGACLGSFVFPVLFKYCNDVFGIRGCFLIFGALMMNAVAFSFFIRSPPWRVKARKAKLKAKRMEKQKQILSNGGPQENKGFVPDLKLSAGPSTGAMVPVIPQSNGSSKDINMQPTAHSNAINTIPELDDIEEDHVSIATYQHVEVAKKKLVNRVSLLMGLTYVFVTYSNMAFMTVLMDFAQDRHVPLDKAVYLLSGFATSDIVGRLSVGWVSDKGLLENKTILGLSCSAFGLCMQVLPFFSTYEGIMFMSILVGYAIGNTVVLFNVVLGDAVGVERIPTAIGCISFVAGLTAFSRPFLIGEHLIGHRGCS